MAIYDINGNDLLSYGKQYIGNMKPSGAYDINLFGTIASSQSPTHSQGMAITGNTLAMLSDGGGILLYDLSTSTVIGEYSLACASENNHANSASFSTEQGTTYPLLYVSECYGDHRCFVEDIGTASSTTVQTIAYANADGDYTSAFDWILDAPCKKIMTYGISGSKKLIKVFSLPNTNVSEVTLTEADVIEEWCPDDYAGESLVTYQGNTVYGNIIYLPVSSTERILAFDKTSHALVGKINLTSDYGTFSEVEDVAIYNGKLMLSTNNRRLYEFDMS